VVSAIVGLVGALAIFSVTSYPISIGAGAAGVVLGFIAKEHKGNEGAWLVGLGLSILAVAGGVVNYLRIREAAQSLVDIFG
jgi:hypothetical protein